MTQRIRPNLSTAIYLSVACSVVLSGFSGFHAREAVWMALPASVVLLCALNLTETYLPYNSGKIAPMLMMSLLLFAAAYEILALWQLYLAAYNGAVTLGFVVAAVLVPTLYQRGKTPLAQSSNFLLILIAIAMLLMLVSVAPQLRVTNLATGAGGVTLLGRAGGYELSLTPELLIVALFPHDALPEKQENNTAIKAVLLLCLGKAALCILLELFYGNAIMWRSDAFHTATASGTISMFKRMEWFQLLLWTLAVSVKVALLFLTMWVVWHRRCTRTSEFGKDAALPIKGWIGIVLSAALLVAVLKNVDFKILQFSLTVAVWAVWMLITIGGVIRCTLPIKKFGA